MHDFSSLLNLCTPIKMKDEELQIMGSLSAYEEGLMEVLYLLRCASGIGCLEWYIPGFIKLA